jgi:selenocysteine lyase/cysteine desulfurase
MCTPTSSRRPETRRSTLSHSLPYLRRIGVDAIHAHRQPMLARLHREMPRLGFTTITPPETTSALIAFTRTGLKTQFGDRLAQAQVAVTVDDHRLRISPSLFNDDKDIDALRNALS